MNHMDRNGFKMKPHLCWFKIARIVSRFDDQKKHVITFDFGDHTRTQKGKWGDRTSTFQTTVSTCKEALTAIRKTICSNCIQTVLHGFPFFSYQSHWSSSSWLQMVFDTNLNLISIPWKRLEWTTEQTSVPHTHYVQKFPPFGTCGIRVWPARTCSTWREARTGQGESKGTCFPKI